MNKRIHSSDIQDLILTAGQSDRGRAHLNTHDSLDADVQRLFIATSRNTVCCQPGTIALEVKQAAYAPTPEKDLAPWSPIENTAACGDFLTWMRTVDVGSTPE